MPRHFQRRLWVSLLATGVALVAWKTLPALDGLLFRIAAPTLGKKPFFITGNGSHEQPWTIRGANTGAKADPKTAPVIVSIGDDTEHFFQSSPPLSIDAAVILNNFHRRGVKRLASAAVFSWESPDPISLVALEKTMAGFESLVTAAPLSRGATPLPMPASFRRASIPLSSVNGGYRELPIVNRVPIPNAILGAENGWSGFSSLDAEENSGPPHLLARWDDRVVFSFPVLAVLQSHGLPLEGIRIHAGEYLALSEQGPYLPIDPYGRLVAPLKSNPPQKVIPASAMISDTDEILPAGSTAPIILRDDQSAAEAQTREFSGSLSDTISALSVASVNAVYQRLKTGWEISLILLTAVGIGVITCLARRNAGLLFLSVVGVLVHWLIAKTTHTWLPLLPFLAATGGAALATAIIPFRTATKAAIKAGVPTTEVIPAVVPEHKSIKEASKPKPAPESQPIEVAEVKEEPKPADPPVTPSAPAPKETPKPKEKKAPPAKKAAKKTATKKVAAKKTAAKKTASKKARGKKQPPASDS